MTHLMSLDECDLATPVDNNGQPGSVNPRSPQQKFDNQRNIAGGVHNQMGHQER